MQVISYSAAQTCEIVSQPSVSINVVDHCHFGVSENERKLTAACPVDQSTSAVDRTSSLTADVATVSGRSKRSTVVGRSTDDNANINERCATKSDA